MNINSSKSTSGHQTQEVSNKHQQCKEHQLVRIVSFTSWSSVPSSRSGGTVGWYGVYRYCCGKRLTARGINVFSLFSSRAHLQYSADRSCMYQVHIIPVQKYHTAHTKNDTQLFCLLMYCPSLWSLMFIQVACVFGCSKPLAGKIFA